MTVTIKKGAANGALYAPPSKSIAHRCIICGALSEGTSVIDNVIMSDDVSATLDAVNSLCAKTEINGRRVTVKRIKVEESPVINCSESGSTLRFLIPVALALTSNVTFIGAKSLFSRPLNVYKEICEKNAISFKLSENSLKLSGRLSGGTYKIRGDVSSQFISGLMFALPLCGGGEIVLLSKLLSKPYVDMTADVLKDFGINVTKTDSGYKISGSYTAKKTTVEGDYSNAAFFDALNLFGGRASVLGLNSNSLQGDKIYKEYFDALNNSCPTLDISDCPDLAPVLFCVAAAKNGGTFLGTDRLKIKESDRGLAMKEELEKFGVKTEIGNDVIKVYKEISAPKDVLKGHNDHRIVMALSVLCTLTGGTITGAEAVNKSCPEFFKLLKELNIEVIKE